MRAYEFITLLEASYDSMISSMKRKYPDYVSDIDWGKTNLKRQDRIVWYLRILNTYLTNNDYRANNYRVLGYATLDEFKEVLLHYIGQNIPKIQSYVFDRQPATQIFNDFERLETEYQQKQNKNLGVKPQEGDYKLIKFQDGSNWWYIDRAYCPEEGRSGMHCGNIAGKHVTNQRILSYRDKDNRVILTFILEPDGKLGEMKAKGNLKPDEKYHPMIMQLLLNPMIKGIRGMGYLPDMNFSIFDLDEEYLKIISERKPTLISDQIGVTPYEILNAPDWIKTNPDYIRIATSKLPALDKLLGNSENNIDQWSAAINSDPSMILYAPDDYPNYENNLIKYFLSDGVQPIKLLQVRKKYRTNPEFLSKVLEEKPALLSAIPATQVKYRELSELAVRSQGWVLRYVPEELRDYNLCMIAVKSFGGALEYVPKSIQNDTLITAALKNYGPALQHIPVNERTEEQCKIAVNSYGTALEYVPDQYRNHKLYMDAVTSYGRALEFVPMEERSYDICLKAIEIFGTTLKYVPLKLRDYNMCLKALRSMTSPNDLYFSDTLAEVPINVKRELISNFGNLTYANVKREVDK